MCDCIEQVDKALLPYNTQLNITMTLSDNPSRARIETMRLSSNLRDGPKAITATFCPFCGIEYTEVNNA